jgi:UPF0755 protein
MKHKKLLFFLSGAAIVALIILIIIYNDLFGINIIAGENSQVIYIPTGSFYAQVMDTLESKLIIKNRNILNWISTKKNYPALIKPGRYVIDRNLTYNGLINMLRSGKQSPVNITFNNVQTLNQIAGKIGRQLEADSTHIITFLTMQIILRMDSKRKTSFLFSYRIPTSFTGIPMLKGFITEC